MLKNICILFFILLLGFIAITLATGCKQYGNIDPADNTTAIKVNDWTVTGNEFNEIAREVKESQNEYAENEIARKAADISVNVGLLVTEAYKNGLDKDNDTISRLSAFERETLVNAVKKIYDEKYEISLNELRAAYLRRNKKLRLGHAWVKIDNKELASRIVQQLRIGADIELMAKYRQEITRPRERELIVFEVKTVTGGDMINEIEKVAYSLKLGQVKIVKTKSGYHVLKLLDKMIRPIGAFDSEIADITKQLRHAKIEEDGGLDVDRMKEESKLKLDGTVMQSVGFPPSFSNNKNKEPKDNQIVATIFFDEITVGKLKSEISKLPIYLQRKFENKYTREAAVRKLLLSKALNHEENILEREKKLISKLLKSNLQEEKNEIIVELKRLELGKYPTIIKFDEKKDIKINREILYAMTIISDEQPINSAILANFDGGNITVGRFREAVDRLPVKTRQHLGKLENKQKFIKYLVFSNFLFSNDDVSDLKINEGILKKISCKQEIETVKTSQTELKEIVSSNLNEIEIPDMYEPVAVLGKVFFTLRELEEKVSHMSLKDKKDFEEPDKRSSIVEKLLVEKAYLKEAQNLNLLERDDIKLKIRQKKEHLMIEKLMEKLYNTEAMNNIAVVSKATQCFFYCLPIEKKQITKVAIYSSATITRQNTKFNEYLRQLKTRAKITVYKKNYSVNL